MDKVSVWSLMRSSMGADGVDEFCSGFEDKIGCVVGERCDGVHVICDAIAGSLGGEFACGGLGELFYNEWAKFGESLVALGFGFPFLDGRSKVPVHLTAALKSAR